MKSLLTLFIIFFSSNTLAEIDGLFGINLGKPFPNYQAPSSSQNIPFLFFRVPVPDKYEISIFHDFAVRISNKTKNVFYIYAERAYRSQKECMANLASISKRFTSIYGEPTEFGKWSTQSGNREAFANCVRTNSSPYDKLFVYVVDKNEAK